MNKFNLKQNDIIVILVIFIVFCVFMYLNNYNTYEKFQVLIKNKENDDDIIINFMKKLVNYIQYLKKLNENFYNILKKFKESDYDQTLIFNVNNLSTIKNYLLRIKKTLRDINNISLDKNEKSVFNDFFNIHHNHILKEYTNLFNVLSNDTKKNTKKNTKTKVCSTEHEITKSHKNFIDKIKFFNYQKLGKLLNKNGKNTIPLHGKPYDSESNKWLYYTVKNGKHIVIRHNETNCSNKGCSEIKNNDSLTIDNTNYNVKINKKYLDSIDKLDEKIGFIDLYFKNLKTIEKYDNVMNIFSDYRYILTSTINNFNKFILNLSLITKCSVKTLMDDNHDDNVRELRTTHSIITELETLINNFIDENTKKTGDILSPDHELVFETKFCNKLKKLNKVDNSNFIFKRFTNDIIQQKKKYIKKIEDNIKLLQDQMSDKELNDYNTNRLRTDDQARKQYNAIKQSINNIKNKNKIKINLT